MNENEINEQNEIDPESVAPAVEAILFAAGFPVRYEKIAEACGISHEKLEEVLSLPFFSYEGRGIRLVRFSDSCQLCSNELYEKIVKSALGMRINGALSASAMETLAIIAYNQPTTKAFIEQVRGVDCSYALTTLTEKELIEVSGRLDVPGRPNLYSTTATFLRCFGLASISELPKNEVLETISGESENENTAGEQKTGSDG